MSKLTGLKREELMDKLKREELMDKMLLVELFGTQKSCCRLKNREAFVNLGTVLDNAVTSQETEKLSFSFFTRGRKYVECLLCVSKKLEREGV